MVTQLFLAADRFLDHDIENGGLSSGFHTYTSE
jgi:hypothetical protein